MNKWQTGHLRLVQSTGYKNSFKGITINIKRSKHYKDNKQNFHGISKQDSGK